MKQLRHHFLTSDHTDFFTSAAYEVVPKLLQDPMFSGLAFQAKTPEHLLLMAHDYGIRLSIEEIRAVFQEIEYYRDILSADESLLQQLASDAEEAADEDSLFSMERELEEVVLLEQLS